MDKFYSSRLDSKYSNEDNDDICNYVMTIMKLTCAANLGVSSNNPFHGIWHLSFPTLTVRLDGGTWSYL